ncbi:PAS domain-containing protein [Haloterrigena sp. SYSU A558-1]|uniref:histidine kinase n=1 Tax=Haloterrigena gelatinilytica TaxID=2741724 RepID=A0ABX2L6K8_9EURY|nr:histidine kinase N-terminal 7TM domain-containing protein [Haloterrigena gelatinilytica]NUC71907.1 PAS domain-containing protein [Haloterrigena gelatinilytica]
MGWMINPYSIVLLLSLAVAVGTAVAAWRSRPAAGSVPLSALMASVAFWLGTHVLEVESTAFVWKARWADLQWVSAALIPTLVLVFALEYTGRDRWLTRRRLGLLAIEPLVMIGLLALNGRTRVLWGPPFEATVPLNVPWADPATVVTAEPNVGLFVHLAYATLCLAATAIVVLDVAVRSNSLHRWQGIALLVAVAVPWSSAVVASSSLEIIGTTPIGLTITGLAITFGLYRYHLLELAPIARNEVVANLEDGVLVVDADRRIIDSNPVAQRLFERDRDALVGTPVDDVVPTVDVDAVIDAPSEDGDDHVAQFSLADGAERRTYELSVSPIDGRGGPLGWTIVVHDVTDRVRRERELERKNRKLDEFASVVSHDLRNPLTVSKGYLDLLEEEYDPEHVRTIARSHERMEELIDDVLTLARQGQAALEPEPVALETAARAAWETVDTGDAALTVADDRTIRADPAQFRQLLENLFRNAVEHGSTGSPSQAQEDAVEHGSTSPDSHARQDDGRRSASSEPSVADAPEDSVEHGSTGSRPQADDSVEHGSTSSQRENRADDSVEHGSASLESRPRRQVERDGGAVTVTVGALEDGFYVADTGRGFAAEPDRLFEPGYTTGDGGTGLGLSIVADVVDHHGWSIAASDADGGGARFEITGVEFVEATDDE